ncbi:MAG: hypothetical protein J6V00_08520 [Bacteroidaceae bacterium]|nr:hypothetical protein [Bacteroidaceae bacterium]
MKRFVFLFTAVFLQQIAVAQDVMVMMDASEKKVKVLEITDSEIKYKLYDDLDGVTYSTSRSKIFLINFENGKREVITNLEDEQQTPTEISEGSAKNNKYGNILEAQDKSQEDIHEKHLYFTVEPNIGGVFDIFGDKSDNVSTSAFCTGVDFFGEYFFNKKSYSGIAFGIGYNYRRFDVATLPLTFNAIDFNVGYTMRDNNLFFGRLMLELNVPLSSYVPGRYFDNNLRRDCMEHTNVTVGFNSNFGVHFGGFNVGAKLGFTYNPQFEDLDCVCFYGLFAGYSF